MENLDMKRARLRLELQEAHGAWLRITEARADLMCPSAGTELSGSPKETQAEWFEYLAAKERLVLAYAEQSAAA
jgi:hypothetical protein